MQCNEMGYAWDNEECSVTEYVSPGITRIVGGYNCNFTPNLVTVELSLHAYDLVY